MKEVFCYLCGSEKASILREQDLRDPYLDLVNPEYNRVKRYWKVCQDCGFVYHSPTLTSDDEKILYARYRDESFRKESPDAYFDRITSLPPEKSENFMKISRLLQVMKQHSLVTEKKKHISVLDIGCGGGVLLYTFRTLYPHVQLAGVEPTEAFAELAKRRLNVPVITARYREGLFAHQFDIILCTAVLEHVYDLRSFVSVIVRDLSEDGVLFIEVPDILDFGKLPTEHDRLSAPHHYSFSPNSLKRLLGEQGLEVVFSNREITLRGRNTLSVVAKKDKNIKKAAFPADDYREILKLQMSRKDSE